MSNIKSKLLQEQFVQARKEKNEIGKALFSTLKGEYDTAVKKGQPEDDSTIEKIAKKMTENAKEVNTPDALQEIELLKPFMPLMLDESLVRKIIIEVIESNPDKANNYKLGNKGAFTGMVMKQIAGKANIEVVNKIIEEVLS